MFEIKISLWQVLFITNGPKTTRQKREVAGGQTGSVPQF